MDEEGIGRVAVPDNALDELDTIMIGGILNSQFREMTDTADYIKYSNFTGCISGRSKVVGQDELDTVMIGGILNSQFREMTDTADYIKYSNFTGCISGRLNWYKF